MRLRIMGILTMLCSLIGCNAQSEGFKSLSVEEYAKAIEDTTIVRLDVRTAEEYADGHIENTLNIDVLKDDFQEKALITLPKDKTIAVNCRSGKRSKNAAKILVKNGYKVIELDEGYNGWVSKGPYTLVSVFIRTIIRSRSRLKVQSMLFSFISRW